jgi:drug/metabolite transporter (DMT)-like permease
MVLPDQYSHNNPYSPVNPVPILQDNHHPDNRPDRVFYHPIMQTEMMVVAEMLCLFAFLFFKGKDEEKEESSRKPKAPILVCLIPLAMDLIATTIEFVAMNYLSGSVFSITSSIVIVSTAISTKILVRKTFNKYQIIGCMLAIGGVVVTGLA